MKAFVGSQFGYCPPIRMFHRGELNNKINRIHESALRIYRALVLADIKLRQSLRIFKRKVKIWVPLQCQRRFCKINLQHVGLKE